MTPEMQKTLDAVLAELYKLLTPEGGHPCDNCGPLKDELGVREEAEERRKEAVRGWEAATARAEKAEAALSEAQRSGASARETWRKMAHDLRAKDRAFAEERERRQAAESSLADARHLLDVALDVRGRVLADASRLRTALEKESIALASDWTMCRLCLTERWAESGAALPGTVEERRASHPHKPDCILARAALTSPPVATPGGEEAAPSLEQLLGAVSPAVEAVLRDLLTHSPGPGSTEWHEGWWACARKAWGRIRALQAPPDATAIRNAALPAIAGAAYREAFEAAREEAAKKAVEAEQARWQQRLHAIPVVEDQDASGNESGDPLDFTADCVQHAVDQLVDERDQAREALAALQSAPPSFPPPPATKAPHPHMEVVHLDALAEFDAKHRNPPPTTTPQPEKSPGDLCAGCGRTRAVHAPVTSGGVRVWSWCPGFVEPSAAKGGSK